MQRAEERSGNRSWASIVACGAVLFGVVACGAQGTEDSTMGADDIGASSNDSDPQVSTGGAGASRSVDPASGGHSGVGVGSVGTGGSGLPPVCLDSWCETSPSVELPVEILGAEGLVVGRTLPLSTAQADSAVSLWLQVNNLGYEDKAAVRVNQGEWLDLNHETVEMHPHALARGGMEHGGHSTIRLQLSADEWVEGDNSIEFRFNESNTISIGYRVIRLQLLDSEGENLLPDSLFFETDPETWEPPLSDQVSIDEGEALWRNGQLWSHYLGEGRRGDWYDYDLGPRRRIRASCSDCHAQDGRDLELFAYSNFSIIERSKFHGLTQEEGEKIASYIRSLSSRFDNVGRYGRPWNPPFQPGPAVSKLDPHEWPAGAGLDAVLEEDSDMLLGMFGKKTGITREEVDAYFDSDEMWNTALQPLAIQLPDWKHWLPLIHPKDAFDEDWYTEDLEHHPERALRELRGYLSEQEGDYSDRILNQLGSYHVTHRNFFAQEAANERHWRTSGGGAERALRNGVSLELAVTSVARLLAVKGFEVHHEFDLLGIAPDIIDADEQPRARQWQGRKYNVFEVPPHFAACAKSGNASCRNFEGQPAETGQFESTAWYQLQQVINPGNGTMSGVAPVDYNYMGMFILRASSSSGVLEPVRFYFSSNVMYQTFTRTEYFEPRESEGFNMRKMGPWSFLGTDNRNSTNGVPLGDIPGGLDSLQPGLGEMVLTAQLRQFVREMSRPRNDVGNWSASMERDLRNSDMPDLDQRHSGMTDEYGQKIYWSIPQFIDHGVDCTVIDDLTDWCARMWPDVDWERAEFQCE